MSTSLIIRRLSSFDVVQMAARSKAWVYGRSPAEIVGSNPTWAWMFLLCFARQKSLQRAITRPEES